MLQKGQLGRPSPAALAHESPAASNRRDAHVSRDGPWYAYPGPVPNIGPRYGRRATWVGASGDQTYLRIDESLINSLSLMKSTVMANKGSISKCLYIYVLIP
jgi:E3 ubiquitin-protein ligase MYCBP2